MDMKDVKATLLNPRADSTAGAGTKRQSSDRAVVWNRDGGTTADNEVRHVRLRASWADKTDLVAATDELLTQVNRVSLNTTWDVERVRAHHSDSHGYFDLFLSAGHSGCIMCQSAGCWAISDSKTVAMSWTMSASLRPSVGTKGCATKRQPSRV